MRRNMFKTERREGDNLFAQQKKLLIDDANFPALSVNEPHKIVSQPIDFFSVVSKEKEISTPVEKPEPLCEKGWVKITRDEVGQKEEDEENEEEYVFQHNPDPFSMIRDRAEQYKADYIRLYGEEEYIKYYEPSEEEEDEQEYD